ncbi:Eco57I restriction-modification methylase domain-containing protein [Geitlerinema sp. P-1104]|uniref:Eco57I restriction-modification methylase domain-containing protein n=1 Tax=Geitlerinema sp. P-1104 TaxID=2546230 RepID=UPI00197F798E|nr:Eco57I restriction-modification methylase domain-containing protein [Geitlerinema sp. P-1104]
MASPLKPRELTPKAQLRSANQSQFSQFFTSPKIAQFMAGLFTPNSTETCHLLDAGAGLGSLSAAFLNRAHRLDLNRIELDAFEIDPSLHSQLTKTLVSYQTSLNFKVKLYPQDFIHAASDWLSGNLFAQPLPRYHYAILNPPYQKIHSHSPHRKALRQVGIETVNLYSAFIALSLLLLADRGQLVAIAPRSFCNGPYYRPFRKLLLQQAAIRQIHLFESRRQVFKKDDVLQENIILHLERRLQQGDVTISTSTDDTFYDLTQRDYPFHHIVSPSDPECFIHIPTSQESRPNSLSSKFRYSLADLGIQVSTGPVVDFRLKPHLRQMPDSETVPLIYPIHIQDGQINWPQPQSKKANAIALNIDTQKWLYSKGFYCVVRRFSSKEEKRRIIAGLVKPSCCQDSQFIGFENHLNVFHINKQGLPPVLARGLMILLNSTLIDQQFRQFSGHTQVNVTDLKQMRYPSLEVIGDLGHWSEEGSPLTQEAIDNKLTTLLQ